MGCNARATWWLHNMPRPLPPQIVLAKGKLTPRVLDLFRATQHEALLGTIEVGHLPLPGLWSPTAAVLLRCRAMRATLGGPPLVFSAAGHHLLATPFWCTRRP